MLDGLGLSEWVLGGAGILALIAAMALRAFKNERVKRKAAEGTARVQAGKAKVEEDASKARMEVLESRDAAIEAAEKAASEKHDDLDTVERSIVRSSIKELAAKWNTHFKRTKKDSENEAGTD